MDKKLNNKFGELNELNDEFEVLLELMDEWKDKFDEFKLKNMFDDLDALKDDSWFDELDKFNSKFDKLKVEFDDYG